MASKPQAQLDLPCPDCSAILPTRQGLQLHRRSKHGWEPTDKVCTRCGATKPIGAFGPIGEHNTRPRSECRPCRSRPSTMTPSQERRDRKKYVGSRFGITTQEWELAVEYLTRRQNGLCAICATPGRCLVLDHCHSSGRLRAMLCHTCNSGLGLFRDQPHLLRAAADYLGD